MNDDILAKLIKLRTTMLKFLDGGIWIGRVGMEATKRLQGFGFPNNLC